MLCDACPNQAHPRGFNIRRLQHPSSLQQLCQAFAWFETMRLETCLSGSFLSKVARKTLHSLRVLWAGRGERGKALSTIQGMGSVVEHTLGPENDHFQQLWTG